MKKQGPIDNLLSGGGEMGKLIAGTDWSGHPLGPIDGWPQSLKSALGICLHSQFPMAVYWGEDLYTLYNDAWSPIPGDKHPWALGKPAREVWSDIWDIIEPPMKQVFETGKGNLFENNLLPMLRRGYIEECYFDYTFNPIYGEDRKVAGLLNVGAETTRRHLTERRERTLRRLSEKSITAESPEAACIMIANALSEAPEDITFGLIYLLNNDKTKLRLVANTSIDGESELAASIIDLQDTDQALPFEAVIRSRKPRTVKGLGDKHDLPGGAWEEPGKDVVMLPINRRNSKEIYGVMIIGLSPRLPYDRRYEDHLTQITEQTALGITFARELQRKLNLEERERDIQRQLQTALSSGAIGIWAWDIPGDRIIADANLADRFGVDPEEAKQGLPLSVFTEAIHPDDRDWVLQRIENSIRKSKVFEAEYRVRSRDGSIHWVMVRGKVEDDKRGNPVRFPGVMVDITDRKEVESELASSERMFNALFESNIMGIAIASLDGTLHEANETFMRMFGYTKKELDAGFHSDMITPPKSKPVTNRMYRELRKSGEFEPAEKEYRRKNGSIIPTLVGAVMIPGSSERFIAFMLDISEQKQLMALNKAKDEFISIASHQLRTPATGVKQYLGMLIEGYVGQVSPEQKNILETAYKSNERQLAIVNDLLRVAQADASEVKLQAEKIDLANLLQDVIKEQSQKFAVKNQSVRFSRRGKTSVGLLDPLHIRMVFENLIDNAHKYTPANKTIDVSINGTSRNLIVRIKDEGVGIRKKDMPRLFKKFSRIENPLSTAAGGTGLGLYWVDKIVRLHKGTIEVISKYKKGTEFVIVLPTGITIK